MFVPTKQNVKLSYKSTGHAQGIGIILCHFPNCTIIYSMGPVYYCPVQPSNILSLGTLKYMLNFKRLQLNLVNVLTLFTFKVVLGDHPTRLKTIQTILKSKFVKVNYRRKPIFLVPTVSALSEINLYDLIHQCFVYVSIVRPNLMTIKGLMEGQPNVSLIWKCPTISIS